jgi:hypothetical protein
MKISNRRGTVMMETVLILPWFLLVLFAVVQFSFLWVGKLMTEYAAFCAARAALVYPDVDVFDVEQDVDGVRQGPSQKDQVAYQAARQILGWVSFTSNNVETAPVHVPGWGYVPMSGGVDRQLRVRVLRQDPKGDTPGSVMAHVKFYFPLFVPVVSTLVPAIMTQDADAPKYSVKIEATCMLPQPWDTSLWPSRKTCTKRTAQ